MRTKNVALSVLFTILSCGLYGLYWLICLADDVNALDRRENEFSGGMVLLLVIVTCGLYGLYWVYRVGERMDNARAARGMVENRRAVIYLLLNLFGLGIVTYALLQGDINDVIEHDNSYNGNVYSAQQNNF